MKSIAVACLVGDLSRAMTEQGLARIGKTWNALVRSLAIWALHISMGALNSGSTT